MKKLLVILLLATTSTFAQFTYEETFDGDTLNGDWVEKDLDGDLFIINVLDRSMAL